MSRSRRSKSSAAAAAFIDDEASDGKKRKKKSDEESEKKPPKVVSQIKALDRALIDGIVAAYRARGLPIFLGIDVGELNCAVCVFVPFLGERFDRPAASLRHIRIRILFWMRFGLEKRARNAELAAQSIGDEFERRIEFARAISHVVIETQMTKNHRMVVIAEELRNRAREMCPSAAVIQEAAFQKFSACVWLPQITPMEYMDRKKAAYDGLLDMLRADISTTKNEEWIEFLTREVSTPYDLCDALWIAYGHMIKNRQLLELLITDTTSLANAVFYLTARERCNREQSKARKQSAAGGRLYINMSKSSRNKKSEDTSAESNSDSSSSDSDSSDSDSDSDFAPAKKSRARAYRNHLFDDIDHSDDDDAAGSSDNHKSKKIRSDIAPTTSGFGEIEI